MGIKFFQLFYKNINNYVFIKDLNSLKTFSMFISRLPELLVQIVLSDFNSLINLVTVSLEIHAKEPIAL